MRLSPPESPGIVVDLLFASSGIEERVVAGATPLEVFSEMTVPVASITHLIAMKALARDDERRPQDRVDLVKLIGSASEEEVEGAPRELSRIQALGFHRRRDLEHALDDLLRNRGG